MEIDLTRLPGPHKHIALVPQWDFLEMLATAAEHGADVPADAQHRGARARCCEGGPVVGVRYRDADGAIAEMRADLTVACDGRASTLRSAAGLMPRSFGAPMDVWWFRLPRARRRPARAQRRLPVRPRRAR